MKIALVRTASNILKYGSYNIQEIGLAKSLLKHGISTDIYARFSNINSPITIEYFNGAEINLKPLFGKIIYKEIIYYPSLKDDLCNSNYDIVQLLDDSQMMLPFLFRALKKNNIKTILWQGMYQNFSGKTTRLLQLIYDFIFKKTIDKNSDIKIAKTKHAKMYLLSKKYNNIHCLPVGLDDIHFSTNSNLENTISKFKNNHSKILLYIGTIEPRRNVEFIIDILSDLKTKNYGLILIGKGSDVNKISNKIKDYNLNKNVLYFDSIPNDELISVYRNSDIFLLPTKYEIYGMVVMEALHYGLPVIATPEAGPYSIITNNKLGICIPLEKDIWLKNILFYSSLKNEDDVKYRNQYIKNNFNWSTIGDKYIKIILDN